MADKLGRAPERHFYKVILLAVMLAIFVLWIVPSIGPAINRSIRNSIAQITSRVITTTSPSPIIIEKLQALNRLETARQVERHVVDAKSESKMWPQFLFKDSLMMLVQTEIVAGIDLNALSEGDITVDHGTVTIHMPSPQIFYIRIDDSNSKVYMRDRGLFVFNPNIDLERQARLKAEADARQSALHGELLSNARINAERNIRGVLQELGFSKIRFDWAQSGSGQLSQSARAQS